jgi:hypothetical protein
MWCHNAPRTFSANFTTKSIAPKGHAALAAVDLLPGTY